MATFRLHTASVLQAKMIIKMVISLQTDGGTTILIFVSTAYCKCSSGEEGAGGGGGGEWRWCRW